MDATSAFTCPSCGYRFRVKEKFLGRIAECPAEGCSQKMRLNPPAPSAAVDIDSPEADDSDAGRSQPHSTVEERPQTIEQGQVNSESVISVVGQSPSAARRTQRAARRRMQTAPPKRASRGFRIDPTVLGFGAVLAVAAIGWTTWYFMTETAEVDTSIPAADLPALDGLGDSGAGETSVEGASLDTDTLAPARRSQDSSGVFLLTSSQPPEDRASQARRAAEATTRQLKEHVYPYLNTYCVDCHNSDDAEAGIDVGKLQQSGDLIAERKSWERVFRMIKAGAMPPSDYEPRPEEAERSGVDTILTSELFNFDCDLIDNPGRPTVQRLNKAEYNNTIRDLFGVDMTPADNFPADDVGEGFDNIGDVLSVPPLLMEKYLDAAESVASAVIDTRDFSEPVTVRPRGGLLSTNRNKSENRGFKILDDNGEIIGRFTVPATGEYEIRAEVAATQAGDENAKGAFVVDKKSVQDLEVKGHMKPNRFTHKIRLNAGDHRVAVRYLNDLELEDGPKDRRDRDLGVKSIVLYGPIGGGEVERSAVHQRFVVAVPDKNNDLKTAATKVLRPIMDRAFRRPAKDAEVRRYVGLVETAVNDLEESYEAGLALALQAVLVAPEFLYRLEEEPSAGNSSRLLNDYEIASRLSYFLWSSMPDDELFQLASQQQLRDPDVLKQQVGRMLKDEKAEAIVQNFAAQWLNLRNLDDVTPNTRVFRTFNNQLREDMRRETELLFETVMKEDRPLDELITADYTFVNERLAKHYDIKDVDGGDFRRVSLDGTNRAGLLTHASILTLTSNPGRTSPVKRGKWILENLFGDAPPPAPAGVPELEETAEAAPDATLREQLAQHRADPGCAACHKVMDPLGLGLENFDAVGRWRTKDEGHEIDASGTLPSGESFNGPLEMINIVRDRRDKYFRTVTAKMLTYAVGRGMQYYDKCAVDECLRHMQSSDYRFSSMVESIVLSDPFLRRRGAEKSGASL
ncbi:MAG: DUF1592 domain-containing protein [Planctomycetaceae bacterium]|nr:DUF1592 domain-containing protein [Planctomycetaceae bacterium]